MSWPALYGITFAALAHACRLRCAGSRLPRAPALLHQPAPPPGGAA